MVARLTCFYGIKLSDNSLVKKCLKRLNHLIKSSELVVPQRSKESNIFHGQEISSTYYRHRIKTLQYLFGNLFSISLDSNQIALPTARGWIPCDLTACSCRASRILRRLNFHKIEYTCTLRGNRKYHITKIPQGPIHTAPFS